MDSYIDYITTVGKNLSESFERLTPAASVNARRSKC